MGGQKSRRNITHCYRTQLELLEHRSLLSGTALLSSPVVMEPPSPAGEVGRYALRRDTSGGADYGGQHAPAEPGSTDGEIEGTNRGIGRPVSQWARGGIVGQQLAALIHELDRPVPASRGRGERDVPDGGRPSGPNYPGDRVAGDPETGRPEERPTLPADGHLAAARGALERREGVVYARPTPDDSDGTPRGAGPPSGIEAQSGGTRLAPERSDDPDPDRPETGVVTVSYVQPGTPLSPGTAAGSEMSGPLRGDGGRRMDVPFQGSRGAPPDGNAGGMDREGARGPDGEPAALVRGLARPSAATASSTPAGGERARQPLSARPGPAEVPAAPAMTMAPAAVPETAAVSRSGVILGADRGPVPIGAGGENAPGEQAEARVGGLAAENGEQDGKPRSTSLKVSGAGRERSTFEPLIAEAGALPLFVGAPGELADLSPDGHDLLSDLPASSDLSRAGMLEGLLEQVADWASTDTVRCWLPWVSAAALAALGLEVARRQARRRSGCDGPTPHPVPGAPGWLPEGAGLPVRGPS